MTESCEDDKVLKSKDWGKYHDKNVEDIGQVATRADFTALAQEALRQILSVKFVKGRMKLLSMGYRLLLRTNGLQCFLKKLPKRTIRYILSAVKPSHPFHGSKNTFSLPTIIRRLILMGTCHIQWTFTKPSRGLTSVRQCQSLPNIKPENQNRLISATAGRQPGPL